jgi:hypothetical protein
MHVPLQFAWPLGQHALLSHTWPAAHAFPQAPQLDVSLVVSVQALPQQESPAAQHTPLHVMPAHPPHTPLLHVWPVRHAFPQVPQLLGSVFRFLQVFPLQSVRPVAHAQLWPPALQHAAFEHEPQGPLPHAPQLFLSVWRSEQPLPAQYAAPLVHAHRPDEQ